MRRVIAVTAIVWIGLAGTTPVLRASLQEDFSIARIEAYALVTPGSPEKLISVPCLLLGDPARTDHEKVRASTDCSPTTWHMIQKGISPVTVGN